MTTKNSLFPTPLASDSNETNFSVTNTLLYDIQYFPYKRTYSKISQTQYITTDSYTFRENVMHEISEAVPFFFQRISPSTHTQILSIRKFLRAGEFWYDMDENV